jgi:hypothetical protein
MKQWSMPFGRALDSTLDAGIADRTAYKSDVGAFGEIHFQTWSNRAAMLQTIYMQRSGPGQYRAWKPCAEKEGGPLCLRMTRSNIQVQSVNA